MSRVFTHMGGDSAAREQAEAWFARLLAPDCSAQERAEFERWRTTPANAAAYAATQRLWDKLDGMESDEIIGRYAAEALSQDTAAPRQRSGRRRTPAWRWAPASIAASLLIVVLTLYFVPRFDSSGVVQEHHTTNATEAILLDDGSRVQMDLATRIDVRLERQSRDVELTQGRAIFDVAHDAARPFTVEAGEARVTAVGTRFQVDRLDSDVRVTLLQGSVLLSKVSDAAADMRLSSGEQAVYSLRNAQWSKHEVDADTAVSWSRGFHVFRATPLEDAVREINRYSTAKLRLGDPSLTTLTVSGSFKIGDAEAVAAALPAVLPVKMEKQGVDIVLLPR